MVGVFHPNAQRRLIQEQGTSPLDTFRSALKTKKPWESIQDFAMHPSFCGQKLYPRQLTLLKLIYLETENMTAFDIDVIEEWRQGFKKKKDVFGIQPDIWERVKYLKERGHSHFPHVQAVLGRRASKGYMGGILGTERIAYMHSLDSWQKYFGLKAGTEGWLQVYATSQQQAQRTQFADIRYLVESCKYLQPWISTSKEGYFAIRTPADLRRIAELESKNVKVEREIASLKAIALSSNSATGRGLSTHSIFFDEMAHLIFGSGSTKSGEEIYEASEPSLDQFGTDRLIYIPSSPLCLEPSTRVLTEDLRWVPVGSLKLGDKLIGFDEYAPGGKGKGRTWQPAEVTETYVIQAPRYKIVMESGKEIVCTKEHMWLARRSQFDYEWFKTSVLKPGDKIKSLGVDPWEEDLSHEAGYLAGFFDGEGYYSKLGLLGACQNRGIVQEHVMDLLEEKKFVATEDFCEDRPHHSKFRIHGGVHEAMRFLGTIRPKRLLAGFPEKFYGTRIYGNKKAGPAYDTVASVEYLDEGDVIALATSTDTLVAEGLLSHNTKIGKFFELYRHGSVLIPTEKPDGSTELTSVDAKMLGLTDDMIEEGIEEATAEPEMLIFQGPSWILYEDYSKSKTLMGYTIKRPIQQYDERMQRLEQRNPEKFKVERLGQFADVQGAYLDPDKVDAMFEPPTWREPLCPQQYGKMLYEYRIHCDPGRTNANYAIAIAHLEDAPKDQYGEVWPCVIIDYLKVWRPKDFEDHTIDYVLVQNEIADLLRRFPSTKRISFDQWNSAGAISMLKQEFAPRIRITEENFNEAANQQRAELFKSALNLGWVKSYRDDFGESGTCLLEQEMKFLSELHGKVKKQDFGPVTTKDLFDTVSVVTTTLLHSALDIWMKRLGLQGAFGSTDTSGLRHGREFDRMREAGMGFRGERSTIRSQLERNSLDRLRGRTDKPAPYLTRGGRWK